MLECDDCIDEIEVDENSTDFDDNASPRNDTELDKKPLAGYKDVYDEVSFDKETEQSGFD